MGQGMRTGPCTSAEQRAGTGKWNRQEGKRDESGNLDWSALRLYDRHPMATHDLPELTAVFMWCKPLCGVGSPPPRNPALSGCSAPHKRTCYSRTDSPL